MSITEALNQIINNFDLQARLYGKMVKLAQAQLEHLKDNTYSACIDEVNRILTERKVVLTKLTPLNDENKKLQQEVLDELGIERFIIKNLKGHLPEDQFTRLKTAVNGVEKLLAAIDKADRESEQIMRRSLPGKSTGESAESHKRATQAYNQAKKQSKPD